MNANQYNRTGLLKIAGYLTVALAIFQAVITTVPSWALYFGAGEEVTKRLWLLYTSGYSVAVMFFLFALYAFSAASMIKPLKAIKPILIMISSIFLLRGFALFPELLANAEVINLGGNIPVQAIISSIVSLLFGVIYIIGTLIAWGNIPHR